MKVHSEMRLRAALVWLRGEANAPEAVALLDRAGTLRFDQFREILTADLKDDSGFLDITLSPRGSLTVTLTAGSSRVEWTERSARFAEVPAQCPHCKRWLWGDALGQHDA